MVLKIKGDSKNFNFENLSRKQFSKFLESFKGFKVSKVSKVSRSFCGTLASSTLAPFY